MKYRNKKNGRIIETASKVGGKQWEAVDETAAAAGEEEATGMKAKGRKSSGKTEAAE